MAESMAVQYGKQEERQMKSMANSSLKELLDNYGIEESEKKESTKLVPYIHITRRMLLDDFRRHSTKDFLTLYEVAMRSACLQEPSSPTIPRCKVLRRYHQLTGNSQKTLLGTQETRRKLWHVSQKHSPSFPRAAAPCCTENGFSADSVFDGLSLGEILAVFYELRGTHRVPGCLVETAERVFAYLRIDVRHERLRDELAKGDLVQFGRLVVWRRNLCRSLHELYFPYKPENYKEQTGKKILLETVLARKPGGNRYFLTCKVCYESFRSMADFAAHFMERTREITYICKSCGFLRFSSFCSLIYHVLIDRVDGPNTEVCLVCREPQFSLSDHYGIDDPENAMKCASCDFIAGSFCAFKTHVLNHLDDVPFVCEGCGESFLDKEVFRRHQKDACFIKYRRTFYLCCYINFSDTNVFEKHIIDEHVKTFCESCNAEVADSNAAATHCALSHPTPAQEDDKVYHWCNNCAQNFCKIDEAHFTTFHKNRPMTAVVAYECVCGFVTYYRRKFRGHLEACRGDDDVVVRRPRVLKMCGVCRDAKAYNFVDPFCCEECLLLKGEKFKSRSYLCNLCRIVVKFSWNAVQDHFFSVHNAIPLLHAASYVSLLETSGSRQITLTCQLSQITSKDYSNASLNAQYYNRNGSEACPLFSGHAYKLEPNTYNGQVKVFIPKSCDDFVPINFSESNDKTRNQRSENSLTYSDTATQTTPFQEPSPQQPSCSDTPPGPRVKVLTTHRTDWYLRPGQYEEY